MESTFRQGIIYSLTAYLLWGILPIYWKTLGVVQAFEILSNRFYLVLCFCMDIDHRFRQSKKFFSRNSGYFYKS